MTIPWPERYFCAESVVRASWRPCFGVGMYIRRTRVVLTVCLFSLASGCGDSCFLFVSNSGTGTVAILAGNGSSSCQIRKPTPAGAVQFHIDSAETGGQAGEQHIYVTLNGIAGHEDASASLESPGWQELAPELGAHPAQIDLLAHLENSSLFPASVTTGVSAGVYHQLGLRFLPRMASRDGILLETGEANPEKNPCGTTGWHCFVDQDGSVQPLILTAEGAQKRPQTSCYESQASRLRVVQLLFFPKRCVLMRSVSSRGCQSVGHGITSFISFRVHYIFGKCATPCGAR